MIANFAFKTVFGIPLIAYGGVLTLLSLLTTATLGMLIHRGYRIPFKFHKIMAILTVIFGLIHGFFGLAFFLKF